MGSACYLSVMQKTDSALLLKIGIPLVVGILFLFLPLLGDFHFESALLASLVGCFWAGISASKKGGLDTDFDSALKIAGYLFLAGFPLFVYSLLSGCFSIDGLAFWILFPLPSVFFGYAIGRLFRDWQLSYSRLLTVGVLTAIAVGIFLYEFLNYPQLYFFNHVWGGWPGPIYDETVHINSATLFFRTLTILWAALIWHVPIIEKDALSKWIILLSVVAIGLGYAQMAEWGLITPRSYLQQKLGGHKSTEHFELYYDLNFYNSYEVNRIAYEHEFYYQQIKNQLNLSDARTDDKIESYLYAHPWQKKELVGAKYTSYVPIWLEQDQLHIAKQQIEGSLKHELVHVMAKEFGNNLFNGSLSMGMIEGLAVAVAGGPSKTSTIDQIVVSEKPYPDAKELQDAFSFSGFYSGRSGVNYTTSGSFVRFLIDNYPIPSLKKAYRTGDIAKSYNSDWKTMVSQWHGYLDSVKVDSVDQKTARRIFGMPSLFEQKCPHVVSDFASNWDNYQYHLAVFDTSNAMQSLDKALSLSDSLAPIKTEWSFRNLEQNQPEKVQRAASLADTSAELQLLYADAFALTGQINSARKYLRKGQQLYAENPDSLLEPAIATRLDEHQWQIYRDLAYRNILPDSATFHRVYYRTKVRSIEKSLKQGKRKQFIKYLVWFSELPYHSRYFDQYVQMIHNAGMIGEIELAQKMIKDIAGLQLRKKYRMRLEQEREWVNFLKNL